MRGWKIVRPDGTTHNGYAWPLVNARAGQARVRVEADPGGREFTTGNPCPQFPGDGLCLAETARAASSGGIRLAECVGLIVEYDAADILAQGDGKTRVKAVTVVDVWSPLDVIRCTGPLKDANLYDANLRHANLRHANLRHANLRHANLYDANLRHADLSGANLSGANLRHADLSGANLSGANLRHADLSGANLRHADLSGADLNDSRSNAGTIWPPGFNASGRGVVVE